MSSLQLDDAERGFSFRPTDPSTCAWTGATGPTAADLVNRLPEDELADLIYRFGEERASRRIARAIVAARQRKHLDTTGELAQVVRAVGRPLARPGLDPATRTFQALRIAVNGELDGLEGALRALAHCLAPGGRLAVIAFHSLEDRPVKQTFREPGGRGRLRPSHQEAGAAGRDGDPPEPPVAQRTSARLRSGEAA